MPLSTDECLAAIAEHSAGFAAATRDNLSARVEHCPEWSVADLVWHLTEVHWFWGTIAEERLPKPPDASRRPARSGDKHLVSDFEKGAKRLVDVLGAADTSDSAWTWAPAQQNIAFIVRHQVQEAAVHHWDAVHAAGGSLAIAPDVAADAVEEFLTFSVSSDDDPADPTKPSLTGALALRAIDTGGSWTLVDGQAPGTIHFASGAADDLPTIEAPASDLILWLYGRREVDTSPVPDDLLARFRDLTFTD
jgi:uncharacterized protein (TIGR03083 family)